MNPKYLRFLRYLRVRMLAANKWVAAGCQTGGNSIPHALMIDDKRSCSSVLSGSRRGLVLRDKHSFAEGVHFLKGTELVTLTRTPEASFNLI